MAFIVDTIFDNGLTAGYQALSDVDLHICSTEPTTYTEASSTYTEGIKEDITLNAVENGDASGRKVECAAITDGSVTGTDTVTHFAVVNATTLLIVRALSSSEAVTSGNTFTLTAFDVEIPDPA